MPLPSPIFDIIILTQYLIFLIGIALNITVKDVSLRLCVSRNVSGPPLSLPVFCLVQASKLRFQTCFCLLSITTLVKMSAGFYIEIAVVDLKACVVANSDVILLFSGWQW